MQFIDLHRQFDRIEDGVREGFDAVLKHKGFIGGPEIKELQKQLAEYTDVKHVIACASGTDALTVPLRAWDLKETDAVFVPSFTFFASAESITLAGGTPVFVDVDYDTFNMDPSDLEAKVKETLEEGKLTPKGIVAVDLFGLPADFPAIRKVADKYGLFVLEDAAQGFGGTIGDKRAGSFGDVGSTSFFPAKPLGCYGDGGAIFTSDDDMAFLIDSIHVHGKGTDKYDNVRIGYNSRLDTFQAVVLLDDILRHAFAVQAGQIMADNPGILVAHGNGGITGRFDLFAVFQQFGPGGRNFGDTAGFKYSLVVDHLLGGIIPRHAPVGAVLVAGFQHDRVEVILPGGILFQIAGDIQRIAGIHILGDTLTAPGEVDVGGVRAAQQHTGLILDLFVAVGGHLDLNIGVRLFEARHDVIPEYHSLLFREFVDKLDGDLVTGGLCGCCSFRRCLAALSRRCGLRGTSAGASAGSQHAGAEQ